MKQVVEFSLENGEVILVEMESKDKEEQLISAEDTVKKAEKTFEASLNTIKLTADSIVSKLNDIAERPEEVNVEFGLKLDGEVGAIIASAGVEAHYKITLTWKNE